MALRFQCKICGKDIIVKYSTYGQSVECKQCKAQNIVPANATETAEEPDYSIKNQPESKAQAQAQELSTGIQIPQEPKLFGPKDI